MEKKAAITISLSAIVGLIIGALLVFGIFLMFRAYISSDYSSESAVLKRWADDINKLDAVGRSTQLLSAIDAKEQFAFIFFPERDGEGRVIDANARPTSQECREISCVCILNIENNRILECETIKYPQIQFQGHPYQKEYWVVGEKFPTRFKVSNVEITNRQIKFLYVPGTEVRSSRLYLNLTESQKITISCGTPGGSCGYQAPSDRVMPDPNIR